MNMFKFTFTGSVAEILVKKNTKCQGVSMRVDKSVWFVLFFHVSNEEHVFHRINYRISLYNLTFSGH